MSRVFIGRLPPDARESDVENFLRGFGRIRDVSLKRGYGFVVSEIWTAPPFCICCMTFLSSVSEWRLAGSCVMKTGAFFFRDTQEFDDYRDAEDAIDDLNGRTLLGQKYVPRVMSNFGAPWPVTQNCLSNRRVSLIPVQRSSAFEKMDP